MITNLHYAYLFGDLLLAAVWVIAFCTRKDLRRQMITMSVIAAVAGPMSEFFYLRDYWHPILLGGWPIGFEDVLFGFAIGGIASVLYEEFFGKTYARRKLPNRRIWMITAALAFAVWMIVSTLFFGINSIYASCIGFLALGMAMLVVRHDLFRDAVMSGFALGTFMLVMYAAFTSLFPGVIHAWWELKNISGIIIWGAPLEELLWAFSWGFCGGPLYEFATGLVFKKGGYG